VNGSGQVVGTSGATTGWPHAFSWTNAGGMVDLDAPPGGESWAYDVNSAGHVVGEAGTAAWLQRRSHGRRRTA
jgi:probable HAF family extracellular repeat protein